MLQKRTIFRTAHHALSMTRNIRTYQGIGKKTTKNENSVGPIGLLGKRMLAPTCRVCVGLLMSARLLFLLLRKVYNLVERGV